MINRPPILGQGIQSSVGQSAVRNVVSQSPTSLVEHCILFTAMVTLPLEKHIPTVAGMSLSFLIFGMIGAYTIVNRPRALSEVWYHPIFIAAYAFLSVSTLLEFSSPLSRYDEIIRFAQMIGGAVCVAALCRDRPGVAAGICGYIGAALLVSIILYLTSYGMLHEAGETGDFREASRLRGQMDTGITANKNQLAFMCAQGAIVALALYLSSRLKGLRIPLLGVGIFCLVAAFLPMSRGAVAIGFVSAATILYAHGVKQGKALIFVAIVGMGIYSLVPDAVWSRMSFTTEVGETGKQEARARVYSTVLNHLPEYVIAGVGAGNYHGWWGLKIGMGNRTGVLGAHNVFLQITIFWGVLGLLLYLWIVWCVYRAIPLKCGRDELALPLLGVLVSLGLLLFVTHVFYDKWYAFGIGILVGARRWIWPRGIVSAVEETQEPSPRRM
ncbi:MAG: O-antigen ligase family protein [Nitrospira sp.]|nr:O-antigen ligase family protein [Nitrospira sp.]